MSVFKVEFEMLNAAFEEYPETEICRILRNIAYKIEQNGILHEYHWFQTILDSNGNDVGRWAIK